MHIQVVQTWFFTVTLTLRCSPIQREKGSEDPPLALNHHLRNPQGTVPDYDLRAALWLQQPT